jgi:hypothetical protein
MADVVTIGSHDLWHLASLNTHEPFHTLVTILLLRESPLLFSTAKQPLDCSCVVDLNLVPD